ncbi:MAG TPA: hypothetical protein VII78_00510 [Myxococcota bacterium]
MSQAISGEFVVRRRHPKHTARMHARRAGGALAAIAAPPGVFPGIAMPEPTGARERVVSSGLSILIHGLLIAAIALAAYLAPQEIQEQIIEITRIDDAPDNDTSGSPRPRAIAESTGRFAPAPMALQAHVINPSVIQARAANIAAAQAIQVEAITAVAAPREIVHTSAPTVEAARTYQSIATVTATAVDTSAASAQIAGNVSIQAPQGVVVGPRQVTTTGATVGIGGPTALGTGSSVREGIASGRDVVGGKTGERATMSGVYGEGGGRGFGGSGTGAGGGKPCGQRPEVQSYLARVKSRVLARWSGAGSGEVELEFSIDAAGSASGVKFLSAPDPAIGASIAEAMRVASPFEPMSEAVRTCLSGDTLIATFSLARE